MPEPIGGDWSARSGCQAGRALRERVPRATAVLAGNDQMALGLLYAYAEAGIRVPAEVSVIGFDDVPDAPTTSPR